MVTLIWNPGVTGMSFPLKVEGWHRLAVVSIVFYPWLQSTLYLLGLWTCLHLVNPALALSSFIWQSCAVLFLPGGKRSHSPEHLENAPPHRAHTHRGHCIKI